MLDWFRLLALQRLVTKSFRLFTAMAPAAQEETLHGLASPRTGARLFSTRRCPISVFDLGFQRRRGISRNASIGDGRSRPFLCRGGCPRDGARDPRAKSYRREEHCSSKDCRVVAAHAPSEWRTTRNVLCGFQSRSFA